MCIEDNVLEYVYTHEDRFTFSTVSESNYRVHVHTNLKFIVIVQGG